LCLRGLSSFRKNAEGDFLFVKIEEIMLWSAGHISNKRKSNCEEVFVNL
jgi:hypothetical protein